MALVNLNKLLRVRMLFSIIFLMYSLSGNHTTHGLINLKALQDSENFMWFPNPDESGSFYPTYLASSKKQLQIAEKHEHDADDHYHPYHDHGHGQDYYPEDHVHFFHYFRDHPDKGTEIHISREKNSIGIPPNFKANAPIKILIHGFLSKAELPFPKNLQKIYLKQDYDINVIVVDWKKLAKKKTAFVDWENVQSYYKVAFNIIPLGEKIGKLITLLVKEGVANLDKIHVVGFGLGAHAAAVAAESVKTLGKISRITGLNPPRPGFGPFGFMKPEHRLHKESADFVDVIHTNDGPQDKCGFSFHSPLGHADFYPNGGIEQPGCEGASVGAAKCRQARAHQYYEESVKSKVGFKGCKCDTWATYLNGECSCTDSERILMGEHCPHNARGKFYLRTKPEPPFAKGSEAIHHPPPPHGHPEDDPYYEMYH